VISKDHLVNGLRGLLFLIPVAYLVLVLWLQPADRLGVPPEPPWLGRLLYDDWDVAAMALRGVNAQMGRSAGRVNVPAEEYDVFLTGLNDPQQPLRARYYLEYPHACLILFRLGYIWQPGFVQPPASVCDGDYHHIPVHVPQTDHEEALWREFRRATQTYLVVFVLCQLALMAVLWKGYEPGDKPGPIWLCVLPAALYFTLNRFDIVPALLCALSLLALGHKRFATSAALLAAATAIKVYPALLAPLVARYLWDRREAPVRWATAYAATLAIFLVPVLVFAGWESFWGPYQFQLNRGPEGPTIYGSILPLSWAGSGTWPKVFRLGTVLSTVGLLLVGPISNFDSLLRRGAIALIVFVTLPVFYSPQWIIWFLPLLVPLARTQRWLLVPVVALDLVTYLSFPATWDGNLTELLFWLFPELDATWTYGDLTGLLRGTLTVARFVLMGVLVIMLAAPELGGWLRAAKKLEPESAAA
jgi:hypothetical protein